MNKCKGMSGVLNMITGLFVIIGAINWGLVGAWDFDVVAQLFGVGSTVSRTIYIIVGVCGLWHALSCIKQCCCPSSSSES